MPLEWGVLIKIRQLKTCIGNLNDIKNLACIGSLKTQVYYTNINEWIKEVWNLKGPIRNVLNCMLLVTKIIIMCEVIFDLGIQEVLPHLENL